MKLSSVTAQARPSRIARLVSYAVALNGLIIMAQPLILSFLQHHSVHVRFSSAFIFDAQLVAALGLLYLSVLLYRGKRTAWFFTLGVYAGILALALWHLVAANDVHRELLATAVAPAVIMALLILSRNAFTVRSDVASFALSLRISVLVLLVAFLYGVGGFLVLDQHDFHREITVAEAMHRTVDQFDLTTTTNLEPHTRRAHAFMDSLSIVSIASVTYAFVSLFQPLKIRFTDQAHQRKIADKLLTKYPACSEDFFKLWPHDKLYFFTEAHTAGLAYSVHRGVAMAVGDPMGDPNAFDELLTEFTIFCQTNDWTPAFIHTQPIYNELYRHHGLGLQKIGEEAILHIDDFLQHEVHNKYFRQIKNRFTKQGYTVEVLQPPHNAATVRSVTRVSKDWLSRPGRKERGFMMGYFSAAYIQHGPLVVLRDAKGTIQGFINQIPSYDKAEANFDMLRPGRHAPGNSSDFMLLMFIMHLKEQGCSRLNLGLCPLAGLDDSDEANSVTNNALRFLYANGDRFYSFNGLQRFKAKYNPEWQSRYIAYRGGIGGFTRMLNALNRSMTVRQPRS